MTMYLLLFFSLSLTAARPLSGADSEKTTETNELQRKKELSPPSELKRILREHFPVPRTPTYTLELSTNNSYRFRYCCLYENIADDIFPNHRYQETAIERSQQFPHGAVILHTEPDGNKIKQQFELAAPQLQLPIMRVRSEN